MSEELQNLLDKINRDGVQKAEAEAAAIVAKARAEAAALVKKATDEAAAKAAAAEAEAKASATRAQETIRQAARDTIRSVEGAVTTLLTKVLVQNVDAALADASTAAKLAGEAVQELAATGDVTVAASGKLAEALRARLAAQKNVTVVLDDTVGTGFAVRTDGGRVEHAFTGAVVAEALAKRLRPDLAALLK